MNKDYLVMGIGNPLLQDDRAGVEVVEALEADGNFPGELEVAYTVGFEVLDKTLGRKKAVIVDACLLGREPGTILKLTVDDIMGSSSLSNSHAVTLGATLKTGYELFPEEMPEELSIILIEAENVSEFSRTCSPKVQKAVGETISMIRDMAASWVA